MNLANLLQENGHRVTLLVCDDTEECFYPLHPTISIIQKKLSFGITPDGNVVTRKLKFLTDVIKLRKAILQIKPDVVIATEYPFSIAAVLSRTGGKMKLVSWEHHHFHELSKSRFWQQLFNKVYPALHSIVTLNADEAKAFHPFNKNIVTIPNHVESPETIGLKRKQRILTIGRLTEVKGIDLLLPIAKEVLKKHPDWEWKIIGDGDLKPMVEEYILEHQLEDQLIVQVPAGHDINSEYQQAAFYVMTSRNECLPMTLLEALSNGLPCLAFDCETGPRHIIQQGINGWLVPMSNSEAMIDRIEDWVCDAVALQEISLNTKTSIEQFSATEVYQRWHQLFRALS